MPILSYSGGGNTCGRAWWGRGDDRDFSLSHFYILVRTIPYVADKLRTDSSKQLANLYRSIKKLPDNYFYPMTIQQFENLFYEFFPEAVAEAEAIDSKEPKEDSFKVLQRAETKAIEHATGKFLSLNEKIRGLETLSDEVYKKVCMLAFKAYMYDNKRAPIELFRENQYDPERISNNLRNIVLKNEECRDSLKSLAVMLINCMPLDSFPYELEKLGYEKDKDTKQIPTLVKALSDFVDLEKVYAEQLEAATRRLSKQCLNSGWGFINSEKVFKTLVENFRGEIRFDSHPTLKQSLIELCEACIKETASPDARPLLKYINKEVSGVTGIDFNQIVRDKARLYLKEGENRGLELLDAIEDKLSPYQDELIAGIANSKGGIDIPEVIAQSKEEGVDLTVNQKVQSRILADVKKMIAYYDEEKSYLINRLSKHAVLLTGPKKDEEIKATLVSEFEKRLSEARIACIDLLNKDFLEAFGVNGLNKEGIIEQVKDLDLKVGRTFTDLVRKGQITAALKVKNTLSPNLNLDKNLRVITGINGITFNDLESYDFFQERGNLSKVSDLTKLYGNMNERFYRDLVLNVIPDEKGQIYLNQIEFYHEKVFPPKGKEEKFLDFFISFKNKYPENYDVLLDEITIQCQLSGKKIDLALEGEKVCAYIDAFSVKNSFDIEEYLRFKDLA